MARIHLDDIAHAYGPNPQRPEDYALRPMDHVWEDGGAYALLGPSGCGKTTLLNVISGLVRPSEGRVLFDETDVTGLPTEKRNIARVFQFPVIYDTMTVAENLAFPLRNRKIPADRIIAIALALPTRGWGVSASLVVLALPLLIPWNVVGTIWQLFARPDIGLAGVTINEFGYAYNYTTSAIDAWVTVVIMDVWHWTPLVALLCYSGLRAIPDAFYQAAKIDGASSWSVFRFIQLPKLTGVLSIAVLLRFMDSFMIYTEPFVLTGGGPGNATSSRTRRSRARRSPTKPCSRPGRKVGCGSADGRDAEDGRLPSGRRLFSVADARFRRKRRSG